MTPVYFLSLLAVVYGDLIIDIDVTADPPSIDVRNFITTNVITDDERATFGIQDAQLKKAVAAYTNDTTEPEYVYVKKTNKDNDLYVNYPFEEIKRTVKPIYLDAKVETKLCEQKNKTQTTAIEIDWTINGNLTINDGITLIVYFKNDSITKRTSWGRELFSPINVNFDYDDVCVMSVTIQYEATIAGDVAAAYSKKRTSNDGDHHFYAYDVFNVRKAAGLPESLIYSQIITVAYPKWKQSSIPSGASTR